MADGRNRADILELSLRGRIKAGFVGLDQPEETIPVDRPLALDAFLVADDLRHRGRVADGDPPRPRAVVAVGLVSAVVWIVRRRHTPEELRGDWWTDFEADFRAYVRSGAMPSRRPERRPGTGSSSA